MRQPVLPAPPRATPPTRGGDRAGWSWGPAARWVPRGTDLLGMAPPLLVLAVTLLVTHTVAPDRIGGLGLVTVIPPVVIGGVCLLSCTFAATLRRARWSTLALASHVAVLLFLLHGLPGLLEQQPRFTTAYVHVGFVDAILDQQRALPGYDARFSWPGFFSSAGLLAGASGVAPVSLLRWAPVLLELLCLLPVALIVRAVTSSRVLPWLVVWLYLLTNWVGQDYFSPQALGYVLFLSIAALVLRHLVRPGPVRIRRSRAGGRSPRPASQAAGSATPWPQTSPRTAGLLVLGAAAITAALAMSHQLTPVALLVDLGVLVVLRRCRVPVLPVITGLIVIGWISYGAVPFWSGHLADLVTPGGVFESVQSNVTQRLEGDPSHLLVVRVRLVLTAGVWLFGLSGALRLWWRRHHATAVLGAFAIAPFLVLPVQDYGGEAQLRVYIYTLPFMLTAGVVGWFGPGRPTRRAAVAVACAGVLLTPLFYVARYGNEEYEQVRANDLGALSYLYRSAPRGATVIEVAPNTPWTYPSIAYDVSSLSPQQLVPGDPAQIRALAARNPRGGYLVITPSQVTFAASTYGLPRTWATGFERRLQRQGGFSVVYRNGSAVVYKVVPGKVASR